MTDNGERLQQEKEDDSISGRDGATSLDIYLRKLGTIDLLGDKERETMQALSGAYEKRLSTAYSVLSISLPFLERIAKSLNDKYDQGSGEGKNTEDYFCVRKEERKERASLARELKRDLETIGKEVTEREAAGQDLSGLYEQTKDSLLRWRLRGSVLTSLAAEIKVEAIEKKTGFLENAVRDYDTITRHYERLRNHVVEKNLRLVVSIAKKYRNRGVPFQDLIQEGNIGLMTAVEHFEWERGYKFSTYATDWIRQAVCGAIPRQGRVIEIPLRSLQDISTIERKFEELSHKLKRKATIEDVAKDLEMTVETVEEILKRGRKTTISLETPIGDNDDLTLEGTIPDGKSPDGESYTTGSEIRKRLQEVMDKRLKSERNRELLKDTMGFSGRHYTDRELAGIYGIAFQRVGQLREKGLKALRNCKETEELRELLDALTDLQTR